MNKREFNRVMSALTDDMDSDEMKKLAEVCCLVMRKSDRKPVYHNGKKLPGGKRNIGVKEGTNLELVKLILTTRNQIHLIPKD